MSLANQINEGIKEAMKAKEEGKLRALRSIKSAFLLLQTAEGGGTPTEDAYIKALGKLAKQRKDSIEIFEKQNRADLADKEKEELAIIESFLPAQMNAEELESKLRTLISETGASSMAEVGKVMPAAMKAFGGQADGKLISELVKKILS